MHHLRWLSRATIYSFLALSASLHAQQAAGPPGIEVIELDGRRVRVQVLGLDTPRAATPTVVFEAGATNSLDVWRDIIQQVSAIAPVVAYDRAGLGHSEWDGVAPTPRHVANSLGRLLRQIGAEPPYVLVGYSWGGMLARYFAGYNPHEVAGLVLVDPGPLVTQDAADKLAAFEEIGAGRAGYEAYWSSFAALFERAPPAVRAEFEVFRSLMEIESKDRDAPAVPDVPVVVIVAAKYRPLLLAGLPFDPHAHFEADVHHRSRHLQEWVLSSSHGTLVVSNHTTHSVPREDPDLVIWAVQRVLAIAPNRP